MTPIVSPFPQYFDMDGSPLDAGYLFVGQVNQNPETAPLAVYWDVAGTIPAAQPLRTLNGYVVRNGTPAQVFVASDYSLSVRNRAGALVSYSPVLALVNYTSRQVVFKSFGGTPFVVPQGVTEAFVDACAGGGGGGAGGGGGTGNFVGGGGAGGGAGESLVAERFTLTPGDTHLITIGGYGAGGLGNVAGGQPGGNGGSTSIGALVVLAGGSGAGGGGNAVNAAAGGAYAAGYPSGTSGNDAGNGVAGSGGGGAGGSSPFGGGGGGARGSSSGALPGSIAWGYGAGGGGGGGLYNGTGGTGNGGNGGNGSAGYVRIWW